MAGRPGKKYELKTLARWRETKGKRIYQSALKTVNGEHRTYTKPKNDEDYGQQKGSTQDNGNQRGNGERYNFGKTDKQVR